MNAQTPPIFCACAMISYTSVVLPEDSGPKISTIRPRGTPPTPSARSSESAPVGITETATAAASSPRRIGELAVLAGAVSVRGFRIACGLELSFGLHLAVSYLGHE